MKTAIALILAILLAGAAVCLTCCSSSSESPLDPSADSSAADLRAENRPEELDIPIPGPIGPDTDLSGARILVRERFERTPIGEVPTGWSSPLYPDDSSWVPAFVSQDLSRSGRKSLTLSGERYSDMYREWTWEKSGKYVLRAWFHVPIASPYPRHQRLMFGRTSSFDFMVRTDDTYVDTPATDRRGPDIEWPVCDWFFLRVVLDFDACEADFFAGTSREDMVEPIIADVAFDPDWVEIIAVGAGYNLGETIHVDDLLFRRGFGSAGIRPADEIERR